MVARLRQFKDLFTGERPRARRPTEDVRIDHYCIDTSILRAALDRIGPGRREVLVHELLELTALCHVVTIASEWTTRANQRTLRAHYSRIVCET